MNKKLIAVIVVIIVVIAVIVPVAILTAPKAKPKHKNHPPVAVISVSSKSIPHNLNVNFNGSASTDVDKKDVLTYSWKFGDGATGTGVTVAHKYLKDGNYTVNLTVSDGKLSAYTEEKIDVYNVAPEISGALPVNLKPTMDEAQIMPFNISVSDQNGDDLLSIWYLDGGLVKSDSLQYNLTTNYSSAGAHKVKVVVGDGITNSSREWELTVNNVNRPPVIVTTVPSNSYLAPENKTATFSAVATDPDGDALSYTWKLDGVQKATGTGSSTQYNYTPDFEANGTHKVGVTFTDTGTASAYYNWTFPVTNVNRAPLEVGYSPSTDWTMNETDASGYTYDAVDLDGDVIVFNWTLDGKAEAATTTLKNKTLYGKDRDYYSSLFTYSPDINSSGTHVIIAKATDKNSTPLTHQWNITVNNMNGVPVAVASVNNTTAEVGDTLIFDGTDSYDPDGDDLNFTWSFGDGATDDSWFTLHSFGDAGTFTVNLTVTDPYNASNSTYLQVIITKPILPKKITELWRCCSSDQQSRQMLVGDVDNDGTLEAVMSKSGGTDDYNVSHGNITIYDLTTKTEEWKSPDIGDPGPMGLAMANLDADPALEIVMGVATYGYVDADGVSVIEGKIVIYDGATHTLEKEGLKLGGIYGVALADVNSDSQIEILVDYWHNVSMNVTDFSMEGHGGVAVYDYALTQLWNSTGWGLPYILGIDNMDIDPAKELVTTTIFKLSFLGGASDSNVSVFKWSSGKYVQQSEFRGDFVISSAWAIADVNGDSKKDVLFGSAASDMSGYTGRLYVYSYDMTELWTTDDIGGVLSVAVANIDGVAGVEVVVGVVEADDGWGGYTGRAIVYAANGTEMWRTGDLGQVNTLTIGDLDNDGVVEIVAVGNVDYDTGTVYVYSGKTRKPLASNQTVSSVAWNMLMLLDLDGDGDLEILLVDYDGSQEQIVLLAYS